jgi:hypothetical protein
MKITRAELADTYGGMSTEELLDHWESGTLTELAMEVATQELTRRGVALPQVAPQKDADALPVAHESNFETVARSFVPTDMHILRGRLEADGIPAFVVDDNINQTNSLLAVATGGVRLQVASEYSQDAARVIAEVKAGERMLADNAPEPVDAKHTESKPAPNWEVVTAVAVFVFAAVEFVKTMWFVRTYGADIVWDDVSLFATALPVLYFAAALLLACGSQWAIPGFALHLPLNMAMVLFFTPDDPLRIDQVVGWICTAAILYFCLHLRRHGRLA